MTSQKTVREVMSDIFEFPHIPYWFTIRQAISLIKKTFTDSERTAYNLGILVFDEKYTLLGTVGTRDIMRFLCSIRKDKENYESLLRDEDISILKEKPVCDIMVPVKAFVDEDDTVAKAACTMIDLDVYYLPVLDNKKKLIGLIRMTNIFNSMSLTG